MFIPFPIAFFSAPLSHPRKKNLFKSTISFCCFFFSYFYPTNRTDKRKKKHRAKKKNCRSQQLKWLTITETPNFSGIFFFCLHISNTVNKNCRKKNKKNIGDEESPQKNIQHRSKIRIVIILLYKNEKRKTRKVNFSFFISFKIQKHNFKRYFSFSTVHQNTGRENKKKKKKPLEKSTKKQHQQQHKKTDYNFCTKIHLLPSEKHIH